MNRTYEDLTPEAKAYRDDYERFVEEGGGCTCYMSAPCISCMQPGNPINQENDDNAWISGHEENNK